MCPLCMQYNHAGQRDPQVCRSYRRKKCEGRRKMPADTKVPDGWRNYLADPTIHMLMVLNPKLLEARLQAVKKPRPSWERPPKEQEGDMASEEQVQRLRPGTWCGCFS